MNTKTSIVFSIITIAAAVLLFAADPVVATHQAWACGGWGGGWRHHFYGGYSNNGFGAGSGGFGGYSNNGFGAGYPALGG